VDFSTQNGYILYFSDRRGMQFATSCGSISCQWQYGEYGYEDTVNYVNSSNKFAPNGALEPNNYNLVSPEDVNNNGILDNYGVKGVGDGFGANYTTDTDTNSPPSPFAQRLGTGERITTYTVGLANRVTGARHVLKLVDGSLGNLPTMPPGNATNNCAQSSTNPTGCGGFTFWEITIRTALLRAARVALPTTPPTTPRGTPHPAPNQTTRQRPSSRMR
jgi:hypothetical protein